MCPQYRGLDDNNDKFLHQLILNHTITHPSVKELTIVLLSIAPSTSPLEVRRVNFHKCAPKIGIL